MRFESRVKRTLWLNYVVAWIPDTIIAIAASMWFQGGVLGFFYVLIGLQLLYFLVWFRNTIVSWAFFFWWNRKHRYRVCLDFLLENKFPDPAEHQESVESYFLGIVNDEKAPTKLRLTALNEIACLNAFDNLGQIQERMRANIVYEDAIAEYKRLLAMRTAPLNRSYSA